MRARRWTAPAQRGHATPPRTRRAAARIRASPSGTAARAAPRPPRPAGGGEGASGGGRQRGLAAARKLGKDAQRAVIRAAAGAERLQLEQRTSPAQKWRGSLQQVVHPLASASVAE